MLLDATSPEPMRHAFAVRLHSKDARLSPRSECHRTRGDAALSQPVPIDSPKTYLDTIWELARLLEGLDKGAIVKTYPDVVDSVRAVKRSEVDAALVGCKAACILVCAHSSLLLVEEGGKSRTIVSALHPLSDFMQLPTSIVELTGLPAIPVRSS